MKETQLKIISIELQVGLVGGRSEDGTAVKLVKLSVLNSVISPTTSEAQNSLCTVKSKVTLMISFLQSDLSFFPVVWPLSEES